LLFLGAIKFWSTILQRNGALMVGAGPAGDFGNDRCDGTYA